MAPAVRTAYKPRVKPLVIEPEAAPGMNVWGGTTPQAFGRFLVAIYFFVNTVALLQRFDRDNGGPNMSWFGPKLDTFFLGVSDTVRLPFVVDKVYYPNIMLAIGSMSFLGALLFISDIRFGAMLLVFVNSLYSVIVHNFWDYQASSPVLFMNELSHFLKCVSITGGLCFYLATAPGTKHKNRFERTMDALRKEAAEEAEEKKAAEQARLQEQSAGAKKDT